MIDFKQKYFKKFKILTFKDTMHIFFDVSNVNLEVDSWAQFVSKLFKPLIYSNVPFLRIVLKCFDAIQRMLHLSKSNRYTFSVCNFREKYHSYYIFVGVWWFRVWGLIEYSDLYNHEYILSIFIYIVLLKMHVFYRMKINIQQSRCQSHIILHYQCISKSSILTNYGIKSPVICAWIRYNHILTPRV